jgi:3-hydroxyisobutyrate dehydrogenase
VAVTDLKRSNADRLIAAGAVWSDDVKGVCANADVVITVLPSPAISRKVVEGEGGVLEHLRHGGVWIEMSTTDLEDLKRLSAKAAERGISVLECPVTGGVHLANSGEITVLVGGEQEVFQRVESVLQTMGGEIIYMGKMGSASVVKVVTNMLAFIHLVAAGEAMMVPAKYGVDPDATYRAIRASSGNSFVHETESMLILSVPLELGSMTQQIFRRAQGLYGGQAQSPEVVRMLEKACGLELRADGYPTELVAE